MSEDDIVRATIADALVQLRVHVFMSDEEDDNYNVLTAMRILRRLITDQDWKAAVDRAAPRPIEWETRTDD